MARVKRPAEAADAVAPKQRAMSSGGEDSDAPPIRRSSRQASMAATVKIAEGFKPTPSGSGRALANGRAKSVAPVAAAAAVAPRPAAAPTAARSNGRAKSVAPVAAARGAAAAVAPRPAAAPTAARSNRRSPSVAPGAAARAAAAAVAVAPRGRAATPAGQMNGTPFAMAFPHVSVRRPRQAADAVAVAPAAAARAAAAAVVATPARQMQPVIAAAAAAAQARRGAEQDEFDGKVDGFYTKLSEQIQQPRPTTIQEARLRVDEATALIRRISHEFTAAPAHITKLTMQLVLDEARREKGKLEEEKNAMVRLAEEAIVKARQRAIEDGRRAEAARRAALSQAQREEEEAKREREEKNRMEASMIDKECKICYDEIDDGVGCVMCEQTIGCKKCVDDWLEKEKACIICRRPYANPLAQVKAVGKQLEEAIRRKKARDAAVFD